MEKEKKETKDGDKSKHDKDGFQKLKAELEKKKDEKDAKDEIEASICKQHDEAKQQFCDKDKKIAELTDMAQRLQAEMQNYKKHCDRENSDFRKYCHADLVVKILPILDSFELALKHTENKDEFVKGVQMIFGQIYDMLEKEGLRPIQTKGEKFDPYKHEVLLTEKTEKDLDDECIADELQKGYMFKDKVLRYSKVKIFKKC